MKRNTRGLKRGGGPGRRKGVPNKVTLEIKEASTALVDDPVYRKKLLRDLQKRKVAPAVETMLWHYAKGKPVERHEIGTPGDFTKMSDAELFTALSGALKLLGGQPDEDS